MTDYSIKRVFRLNESIDPARKQQIEHQLEDLFPTFGDWSPPENPNDPDEDGWKVIDDAMKKRGLKEIPGNYFPVWYNPKNWDSETDWHNIDQKDIDDGNVIYVGHYDEFWLIAKNPETKKIANWANDPNNQNDEYEQDAEDVLTEPFTAHKPGSTTVPTKGQTGKQKRMGHLYDTFSMNDPRYGDGSHEDELYEFVTGRDPSKKTNGLDDFEDL